ncbi:uncharacterized protein dbf4b isoform X2 [Phyllopteryx taeniolatus]|uniref:uncharacterized protein dbf4b isoform X2 n=1 Tax=Phyllopteryx taeniolatus TaxID=161469 RepID=UPI002AD24AEE|nr:uncharacterized protein dbf4b isoform X2 [Phyllopteryx taeniolatus]
MLRQQCEEQPGLLGKLCPGEKKLQGKTFYLDNVKKRATALLLEAISLLGGGVESFLHRDVSFVVTGSQEGLEEKRPAGSKSCDESHQPLKQRESVPDNSKQRPVTPRPACGSRGKALLEKAIRNNERLQGSNVLANARSWGVSIVHADDVLLYLKELSSERVVAKPSRHERASTKQPSCHVVKAAPLRSPFLKIEDISRKYKPLHVQSMSFPSLCYVGRFSPFESPPPPRFEKTAQRENKSRAKSKVQSRIRDKSQTLSPWPPRKKGISYCECCLQSFTNLDEHLQSDQHRCFALETSNYSALECLVVKMVPSFNLNPSGEAEEVLNRPAAALPIPDICELEPLTDAEIEHEVQALRGQSSCRKRALDLPEEPDHVPSPATISSDMQCPEPGSLPYTSTAPLRILDNFPQVHFPASLQPPPLSLRPTTQDVSSDLYALPPVLSPKGFIPDDMEALSLYSEPPVLSPQNYITEDYDYDMETRASVSEALPVSFLTRPSMAVSNAEEEKVPRPEVVSSEASIPIKQARPATPNLKKRRRHSSCEHNREKRKRTAADDLTESESCVITTDECCCISGRTSIQIVQSKENTSRIDRMCPPAGDRLDFSPFNRLAHFVETTWSPASKFPSHQCHGLSSQDSQQSASLCIDPALIPDVARLSPSSSDSDWDRDLLSRLGPARAGSASGPGDAASGELDKEFLRRPCAWMSDTSYESRLHTALQPSTAAGEPSAFSRTVVQIVEVLH